MNEFKQLRMQFNLIEAIDQCPGIVKIGNTVVKTRNKKRFAPYINKRCIRRLVQYKFSES
jgi:hypothetical protein